jgi:hypothetical protein
MRSLAFLASLLLAAAAASQAPVPNPDAPATAYVGGQWWTGERFEARDTTWAQNGVFAPGPLADAARVVDLGGAHVVPPYGDAHTHMLSDPYQGPGHAELFVRDGVFYALVLTDRYTWAAQVMDRFDGPGSIDVAYVHGGLTSEGTHPTQVYEWQALGLVGQELTEENQRRIHGSRLAEDDAYWYLDSLADAEATWDAFLAHGPDAVKVYLLDVARELGPNTSGMTGLPSGHGLSPEVLREVVRRARTAGLPVYAHVETAADVRLAVEAGVDGFAHLPGYARAAGSDDPYWLDDATVEAAAARGVTFIPTSVVTQGRPGQRPAREALARDLHRRQLRALRAAGAPIALGADRWGLTSKAEADFMAEHGFFDRATLLDLWTRVTPQTVFPGRAIGRLAPGFEASLLALACDPTVDWSCTERITRREKQGADLDSDPAAAAAAWRALDVATLTAPPAPGDVPLLRGLKALARGDLDAADEMIREALAVAPDSLRPFVHRRLAEAAAERFDWAEAVRQRAAAGDGVAGGTMEGFARFPAASARFAVPESTVPFDGLRASVRVNGEPVRAVVDTGAPGSSVPRALAERLGLRIDTTARGRTVVPSMGLAFDTYAVLIDSVEVGGATFYNVPATVAWTDGEGVDGGVFLGANLFRRFAGALHYGYADSTFTVVRDVPPSGSNPTFLIEGGSAPVVPVAVGGEPANAIVDTGNSASVYLAAGAFEVPEAAYSRTVSGTLSNGFEWSHRLYRVPFEVPGHPDGAHEAYEADYLFSADDAITVILGRPVWADGTLTLDFVNRQVRFKSAAATETARRQP